MQQLLADKREREKRVVAQMIQLYCSKQHHNGATLCKECSCLLSYANEGIDLLSVYKGENLLFQLPGTLLSATDARADPAGDALCRTKDAAASSGVGSAPSA